jgi:hypothetical protein
VQKVMELQFSLAWISRLNGRDFYFSVMVVRKALFRCQIWLMTFWSFLLFSLKRGYAIHKNSQASVWNASTFVSSGHGAREGVSRKLLSIQFLRCFS